MRFSLPALTSENRESELLFRQDIAIHGVFIMYKGFENIQTTPVNPGYATPEMYGAAGDGITDDSIAFQKAVDSGKVVVCTGRYKIAGVTLAPNTYIKGYNCALIPIYGNRGAASTMFCGKDLDTVVFDNLKFEGNLSCC